MTGDNDEPAGVTGRNADADFLGEMIGFAAPQLMDLKVGSLTGCGYGKKSSDRLAQRNGKRERDRDSRGHGRAADPQAENGELFPAFLEPRHLSENALTRRRLKNGVFQSVPD